MKIIPCKYFVSTVLENILIGMKRVFKCSKIIYYLINGISEICSIFLIKDTGLINITIYLGKNEQFIKLKMTANWLVALNSCGVTSKHQVSHKFVELYLLILVCLEIFRLLNVVLSWFYTKIIFTLRTDELRLCLKRN